MVERIMRGMESLAWARAMRSFSLFGTVYNAAHSVTLAVAADPRTFASATCAVVCYVCWRGWQRRVRRIDGGFDA